MWSGHCRSHTFDEAVPRVLKHIVQVAATSEFSKPCLAPFAVPYLFHRIAWVENRRVVGQLGLFSATVPLEVKVQMNSVYTKSKWCIRKLSMTELLWA